MMKIVLWIMFFLTGSVSALWAETFTLTTYYPSPKGAYEYLFVNNRMNFNPATVLSGTCEAGDFTINGSTATLRYCESADTWVYPGGIWRRVNDDIFPSDIANENLRVGIGTSTPQEQLHVYTDDSFTYTGIRLQNGEIHSHSDWSLRANQVSGDDYFSITERTGYSVTGNRFVIGKLGTIGLGYPIPPKSDIALFGPHVTIGANDTSSAYSNNDGVLELNSSNAGNSYFNMISNGETLQLINAQSSNYAGIFSSAPMTLGVDSNFTVNIDAANNVGIGTTAPTKKLDVTGDTRINGNIQITGGAPEAGMVLIATDNQGNAVWGWPTYAP